MGGTWLGHDETDEQTDDYKVLNRALGPTCQDVSTMKPFGQAHTSPPSYRNPQEISYRLRASRAQTEQMLGFAAYYTCKRPTRVIYKNRKYKNPQITNFPKSTKHELYNLYIIQKQIGFFNIFDFLKVFQQNDSVLDVLVFLYNKL